MTTKQVKINNISKKLGTTLTVNGFQFIRGCYKDLNPTIKSFGTVKTYMNNIKNIPVVQRDSTYYFTTWENWEKMLEIVWNIIKPFKWTAEKFDCDDRSKIVSGLCSLLFGLNTCGDLYCKVRNTTTGKEFLHWANVIMTSDGGVYLFDVDNLGSTTKLETNQPINMRFWNYGELKTVRF